LTEVFRNSGTLPDDGRLESFSFEPIGTGQMSNSFRVTPEWSGAPAAPPTFVIKLPSKDEGSRMAGQSMGIYDVEVNFYKDFAPKLPMRTPACHFSGIAENKVDFVLVLEDVSPARQGDQMEGCSIEQARLAVTEVTKLHVPFLNDPILRSTPWLNRGGESAAAFRQLMKGFYQGFCGRYADRIEDDVIAMGERYYADIDIYAEPVIEPFSLVHTDYRLDNMLFATPEGGPPITVVDWQTVSCGSPLADVSYFIGAGLHEEERRAHEEELVRLYHDTMLASDVTDFSWDACWEQYRLNSFAGFMMAVMASMLVERTERGDEMFITMARRHGRQILDLRAEELLVRLPV
jgi:hypothetical protein